MRRLLTIPLMMLALLLIGGSGLHLLTGQPLLDCFYQSIVLLTTVGCREPAPLTDATKVFISFYLIGGIGVVTYGALQFGTFLVNRSLQDLLERRRMQNDINRLDNHFIVCGLGRMGMTLCEYLEARRQPFVVIDSNPDVFDEAFRSRDWHYTIGDASDDEVLMKAGIHRARGLTTVLATDPDNLYVVLSARLLRKDLQIVARASDDRAGHKLIQAGATRVMNPFSSGAIRMARFMLSPSIENFVEVAETEGVDWEIADVVVPPESRLAGCKLSESGLRDFGIMLLGVRKTSGQKLFPPPGHVVLEPGDSLFAFASSEGVAKLTEMLETQAGRSPAG
jgi:voltage-gated potassium channel